MTGVLEVSLCVMLCFECTPSELGVSKFFINKSAKTTSIRPLLKSTAETAMEPDFCTDC
jgi:hypothetical protein